MSEWKAELPDYFMTTRPVRGGWPICVMCSMHSLMTIMGSGLKVL